VMEIRTESTDPKDEFGLDHRSAPKDAGIGARRPIDFIRVPKRAAIQPAAVAIVGSAPSLAGNGPWPQFCAGSNACSFRHSE
jgi:hypothetical protein